MASLDRRDRVELDRRERTDRLLDLLVAATTGTSCVALRADHEPSQGGHRDRAHVPQPIERWSPAGRMTSGSISRAPGSKKAYRSSYAACGAAGPGGPAGLQNLGSIRRFAGISWPPSTARATMRASR